MSPTTEISDSYWTLAEPSEGEFSEKRSKFLAYAYPVTTEEEALERVREVRARYYDARHVCWAYRLGPTGEPYRANDDGEPSGTAGKPIHGILVSLGLTEVIVLVVRYFGGVASSRRIAKLPWLLSLMRPVVSASLLSAFA